MIGYNYKKSQFNKNNFNELLKKLFFVFFVQKCLNFVLLVLD